MANIIYRAATTYNSGTVNTTSVTNAVPSGTVAGDLLLWMITASSNTAPVTPSGWEVWQYAFGVVSAVVVVYNRRATTADVAGGVNFTATVATGKWNGLLSAYGNVHAIIPKETANVISSTATTPPITTYTPNAFVVEFSRELSASGVTNSTWTSSTGSVRAQTTSTFTSSNNVTSAMADQLQATPGLVSPNLVCSGTNAKQLRITSTLRPTDDAILPATYQIFDDFSVAPDTAVGVRFAGTRISDSGHPWMELSPNPAGSPPTGDPGIVSGILKPRSVTGAMYPGQLIPNVPVRVVADFVLDAGGTPGKLGVGLHIWGDPRGNGESVPLHAFTGFDRSIIETGNESGNTPLLVPFGDTAAVSTYLYPNLLTRGVTQRVIYDFIGDTIQITPPAEANMYKITLTDARLRAKYIGVSRVMVLEGERDFANEPYNGFTTVNITVVPYSRSDFMPFFR